MKDLNWKFDFKNKGGGGNVGLVLLVGIVDIFEGEEDCFVGKIFVFIGLFKIIFCEDG